MLWNRTLLLACFPLVAATAVGQERAARWTSSRPDGHAPIGVMGDHLHEAGEIMLSYRFMRMSMGGLRDGGSSLTPEQVLDRFMVTPLEMPMAMHMVGMMFAPSDRVTLVGMVPYLQLDMEHRTRAGGAFTTQASGLGDASVTALVRLFDRARQRVHLHAGVSFPTGSIHQRDDTPASQGQAVRLPYPMQTGSGTFGLLPGLTYLGQSDFWSWGAQGVATVRLGENDNDYRVGHSGDISAWGARRWNDWWSSSVRLTGSAWGDIAGRDPLLNPAMVPTADPDLRGGRRVEAFAGVNLDVARGSLSGHRLALELGAPVYRSLDGPQLERDWQLLLGWQYSFGVPR